MGAVGLPIIDMNGWNTINRLMKGLPHLDRFAASSKRNARDRKQQSGWPVLDGGAWNNSF
jgi:hypothetical protein